MGCLEGSEVERFLDVLARVELEPGLATDDTRWPYDGVVRILLLALLITSAAHHECRPDRRPERQTETTRPAR